MVENEKYEISGMTCASCSAHVDKAVASLPGVKEVSVSLLTNSMLVSYESPTDSDAIVNAVKKAGYGAKKAGGGNSDNPKEELEDHETPRLLRRLILSLAVLAPLFYFSMGYMNMSWGWPLGVIGENPFYYGLLAFVLSSILLLLNRSFFVSGFQALIHGGPNMDTLVSLGSGISYLYGIVTMFVMASILGPNMGQEGWRALMSKSMGLTFETAGMVPTLITVGKVLESYSKGKTTSAIKSLLDLAPKQAHVLREGKEMTIPSEDVVVGDIFLVRPGEAFPVDGIVLEGSSAADESSLSGESVPVDKTIGDNVYTSTINQNGALTCKASKVGSETTLRQIVAMVEQASTTKTKISRLADKVSGIFVPTVLGVATLAFLGWLIFGGNYVSSMSAQGVSAFSYALERGISVLVVACPCALGLATPVAIMVGSGKGAKNGILFKTASSLEETGKMDFVVLDKTGTITKGTPVVTDVYPFPGHSEEELFLLAASLEAPSEHPLAKAIRKEAENRGKEIARAESFSTLPGAGVKGIVDGVMSYGGKPKAFEGILALKKEWLDKGGEFSDEGKTPLYFAKGDNAIGIIAVADALKEDSVRAISNFKAMGLTPVMLTGDNKRTASYIASKVGISYFKSDVPPEGKLAVITELKKKGKVMMVGDGINDAPSLTSADVGVAIGAGSDIAIDSADVVLMKGSLFDACAAIRLSRLSLLNIKENLFWAFFYNLIMIPIAAGCFSAVGLAKLKPWYGAAAMALSSLCVVLNALRINLYNIYKPSHKRKHVDEDGLRLIFEEKTEGDNKTMNKELKIKGMMCEHCVAHVKSALEGVNGVASVSVSLKEGKAVVSLSEGIADETLVETVKKAGYEAKVL